MKYMLILNASEQTESGAMPTGDELNAMGRFNEELISAGVLLAGEGLHPSADGARVDFTGAERVVTAGPFGGSNDLIAGFWIIQVADYEEALEWTRRIPLRTGRVEVRRVYDVSEFDQDNEFVQKEVSWRETHGESRTA